MIDSNLILSLFKRGMGEYFILHVVDNKVILGSLVYDKHKLFLRDVGLLVDIKPDTLKPCWEKGLIGMICESQNRDWESLTFYGLENCELPINLNSTRHNYLVAAKNEFEDKLIDFTGSIYRGFSLMLEHQFLPVVLLNEVQSKNGESGLAISDLRASPMPIQLLNQLHDLGRHQADNRLSLTVDSISLNSSDFEELFRQYLNQNN